MNKILIVVQCRFNSSRLCGKALFPLGGVPMLVFLLRRLSHGLDRDAYRIVLATSGNVLDQAVAMWGREEGIDVVRGDEEDVLGRYLQCLAAYPAETLVRVTADNPLTCPQALDQLVQQHREEGLDYLLAGNLPHGAGVDVFRGDILARLDRETLPGPEREHINLHILENSAKFKAATRNFSGETARPDLSMTVDTMEDWQRVKGLFAANEREPWKISLKEAIRRLDKRALCGEAA